MQLMKHVLPMLSSPVHGICLPPSTRILRSKSGLGVKGAHAGGGAGFGDGLPPLPLQLSLCPAFQSVHAQSSGSSGRRPTLAGAGWVPCERRVPRGHRCRESSSAHEDGGSGSGGGGPRSWHSREQ